MTRAKALFVCLFFFSGVKTGSMLVCQPCESTSGNLNKTSLREKSRGALFVSRLSFSELFDDILLELNVRTLYVVVDQGRISAAKVCDCVVSAQC